MSTITHAELKRRIAAFEDAYPDFPMIYGDTEMPRCCKVDEVAHRYGWGEATNDWEEYDGLRFLRGDRG